MEPNNDHTGKRALFAKGALASASFGLGKWEVGETVCACVCVWVGGERGCELTLERSTLFNGASKEAKEEARLRHHGSVGLHD